MAGRVDWGGRAAEKDVGGVPAAAWAAAVTVAEAREGEDWVGVREKEDESWEGKAAAVEAALAWPR